MKVVIVENLLVKPPSPKKLKLELEGTSFNDQFQGFVLKAPTTLVPSHLQKETQNEKEKTVIEKLSEENALLKQKVKDQEKVIYNLQRRREGELFNRAQGSID